MTHSNWVAAKTVSLIIRHRFVFPARTGKIQLIPTHIKEIQANFVETLPLALLVYGVEVATHTNPNLHLFECALLVCRLLHALGMRRNPGANYPRLRCAAPLSVDLNYECHAALERPLQHFNSNKNPLRPPP